MPTKISETLELYDLDELTKKLNLHIVTLQRYCRTGRIKAQKVGRSYKVTNESLASFLNGDTGRKKPKQS